MPATPHIEQPDNFSYELDVPTETSVGTPAGRSPRPGRQRGEEPEHTLELLEEELVARKELHELGEITVRTTVDDVPGRLEVEALQEEIVVEHEPVGQVVSERKEPWDEDGVLVMPVYEEQLVVVKRLVLKERVRVRRVATTARHLFEDTLRRERLVVEDPDHTGMVREGYPTDEAAPQTPEEPAVREAEAAAESEEQQPEGGLFENLVRKALG